MNSLELPYQYQNKCKECEKNIHKLFYNNERKLCFFCLKFIDLLRDKDYDNDTSQDKEASQPTQDSRLQE